MNLSELFERMPLLLKQRLEAEEAYAPWIARGERLENILITPAVMETIWNRMTKSERSVFTAIIRCIGCEPFDEAKLEKLAAGRLSGAEARMGFNSLLRLGLIYGFRKSWGEQVFVMPYELLSAWQQILLPELNDRHLFMEKEEQPAYNSPTDLAQELFHTLVYAAKNGLKLTKQGTLHKKHIQKLDERLRLEESFLTGNGFKYAFSDVYPLRLAIVFDLLLRLELLVTKEEEWSVNRETLTYWLSMRRNEQNHTLYKHWRGLTLPVQSWMQHAAVMLERYGYGEGIHIVSLLRLLEEGGVLAPADNDEEECKRRYVFIDGDPVMFNEVLVREGYANTMTVPPNVLFQSKFVKLEREAREKKKGLWADGK